MIDLSIIIISYNTKKITKKCLDTISSSLKHDPNIKAEVIVVDNNSTDGSVEMLKQIKSFKLKIISNNQNVGFSRANNDAVKEASGNYILFLNSDIEVIDDAIPKLYHYFKNQKEFHFVGGKLLEHDGDTPQPSCGPFYNLPVVFAALFLKGDYWGLTRYSPNTPRQVDWVSGACIITTNSIYRQMKGFDENMFMYMEEIDLFYRAAKKNLRVGFFPEARFIHLGSASSREKSTPILQVYIGFIYFYKKHKTRLQLMFLILMLKLKAWLCILAGKLLNKAYLIKTYEKALETASIY